MKYLIILLVFLVSCVAPSPKEKPSIKKKSTFLRSYEKIDTVKESIRVIDNREETVYTLEKARQYGAAPSFCKLEGYTIILVEEGVKVKNNHYVYDEIFNTKEEAEKFIHKEIKKFLKAYIDSEGKEYH